MPSKTWHEGVAACEIGGGALKRAPELPPRPGGGRPARLGFPYEGIRGRSPEQGVGTATLLRQIATDRRGFEGVERV